MSDVEEMISSPGQDRKVLFCPSAQPGLAGSMIVGVVETLAGEARISYLDRPVKVPDGTMMALACNHNATRVFRFAAPCQKDECANWSGSRCRVAEQLVQILPLAGSNLPDCNLRRICRWFEQEGGSACIRCPQVVTDDKHFEAALNGSRYPTTLCSTEGRDVADCRTAAS